jgi:2-dehydropantoate 2-reductase
MDARIYIIGAGAIGRALAVFVKLNNKNVTLIRGSIDNVSTYDQNISVVLGDGTELTAEIEIATLSNFQSLNGLIVLTSKSFGNNKLSAALKHKVNTSPVIILQNGLGVERCFIENGFSEVYRCVLFLTSQLLTESKVSFKSIAISPIGVVKGNLKLLNSAIEQLNTINFPFRAEENIELIIWKKVIVNCVFNSICPLIEIDNGIFYRNNEALSLAKRIVKECITIAQTVGIHLNEAEVIENILLISKSSEGQFISTLQDIRRKHKTEIETMNFEIVRIAQQFGKENMVNETKLLGELIRLKSEVNQEKS